VVLAQDVEPAGEIVGMADGRDDAERGAEIGRREFGAEFLARVIR